MTIPIRHHSEHRPASENRSRGDRLQSRTSRNTFAAEPADEAGTTDHYADLVEQLFKEYECELSLRTIVAVVNQSRRDLAGSPAGAMPELLERLARCRLDTLTENSDTTPGS